MRAVKIIGTERSMVVARSWREERNWSYCSVGIEFQFYKMKSSRDGRICLRYASPRARGLGYLGDKE